MSETQSTMDATALFECTETALAISGLPQFQSVDSPGQFEALGYVPPSDDEEATWALLPEGRTDCEEYVALDTEMASYVLMAHFRQWLLRRGWQVQVHCYSNMRRWTLVDCLSAADGGGDRLDVDYPYGEEELTVLVDSIIAVNTI